MYRTDNNSNHVQENFGICSDDCLTVDTIDGGDDSENATCSTVSGPAAGSECVFPFTLDGQTFTECAEWSFGGDNQGKLWCSTK